MRNPMKLSEKQKKGLGFGVLGIIAVVVIVVIVELVGSGSVTIATYEGVGDQMFPVQVPANSDGYLDFTVKHKADPGFDRWGLYYPDLKNGNMVFTNHGQEGTETVMYRFNRLVRVGPSPSHSYGPDVLLNQVTFFLDVEAAGSCHWTIEILN